MKLSSLSRLVAAFLALFSMLFMQLAVASYACPGMAAGGGSHRMSSMSGLSVGAAMPAMVNCEGMDSEQPVLCHAHAEDPSSKQALDKPQLPDVQPFLAAGLVLALHAAGVADVSRLPPRISVTLARSTAPPISIRNCCFRI